MCEHFFQIDGGVKKFDRAAWCPQDWSSLGGEGEKEKEEPGKERRSRLDDREEAGLF